MPIDAKLKDFMLANFDFRTLKEFGFWPKGTKANDYETQAHRVCKFFRLENIYQYADIGIRVLSENNAQINGKFADTVDKDGKLVLGDKARP